jgi:Transposase, Mutator family
MRLGNRGRDLPTDRRPKLGWLLDPDRPGSFRRGMSTRKVDDLVRMLAADSGSSTSEVSGICADLNTEAGTIRDPQQY